MNLQLALGKAVVYMKAPGDDTFQILGVAALARPAVPDVTVSGEPIRKNDLEIFRAEKIVLSSPIEGAEIRCTTSGNTPDKVHETPLTVGSSTTIAMQLFRKGKPIGPVRSLAVTLSDLPRDGLVAYLDCEAIDDNLTNIEPGQGATATVEKGTVEEGKKGKAIGLYEEVSSISLRNLSTHDDVSTISCWIKFKQSSDFHVLTGVPYMTEAYDLRLRHDRLVAEFRRNLGVVNVVVDKKDVEPGKWFHVAATYGDENCVYFNGELLGSTQVMNKNTRRGSAREPNLELMTCRGRPTNAAIDECRIYNRVLPPAEIRALYEADK